jgi:hypothetical protein
MRRGALCGDRPPFPPAELGSAFPPPVSLSSRIVFLGYRCNGFLAPHDASVEMHKTVNSFWGGMLEGLRVEDNRFCFRMSFREFFQCYPSRPPRRGLGPRAKGSPSPGGPLRIAGWSLPWRACHAGWPDRRASKGFPGAPKGSRALQRVPWHSKGFPGAPKGGLVGRWSQPKACLMLFYTMAANRTTEPGLDWDRKTKIKTNPKKHQFLKMHAQALCVHRPRLKNVFLAGRLC